MSNDRRPPSFRLTLKYDGKRYDVGTAWESDRYPGLFDISLQEEDVDHERFPKMKTTRAIALASQRDGNGKRVAFLGMAAPKPQGQRTPEQRSGGNYERAPLPAGDDFGGGGEFGGDDIPFAAVDERLA